MLVSGLKFAVVIAQHHYHERDHQYSVIIGQPQIPSVLQQARHLDSEPDVGQPKPLDLRLQGQLRLMAQRIAYNLVRLALQVENSGRHLPTHQSLLFANLYPLVV
jgi:hypothetical protein